MAEQASGVGLARRCTSALSNARAELAKDIPDLSKVIDAIEQVRQLLVQSHESNRSLWRAGIPLAVYNGVWLAALAYLVFGMLRIYPESDVLAGKNNVAWFPFTAIFWGALGGVFDAFFALWKHFSDRDFDVRFWMWYLVHPVLGGGLGIIIYLMYMTGYLSITAASPAAAVATPTPVPTPIPVPTPTPAAAAAAAPPTLNPNFIILLAFIAGFKQTTSYNFIIRVIKSIFSAES
ncbi:MAG: hypothetical protein HY684_04450 [Chloroflexi bacterium]|nr:hypothetical protein [Chloroflexota bacterium]